MGLRDLFRLTDTLEPVTTYRPRLAVGSWDPVGSLTQVVWADLFGTDAIPVTRAEAMAIPAIARGRHLIAGTLARIPLKATSDPADPDVDPANLEEQPAWLYRKDGRQSPWARMLYTADDLLFNGEALWAVERGTDGFPIRAVHVAYDLWDVDPDSMGIRVNGEPVAASAVVHIPGPHDGILGYGKRTIRMGTAMDRAAVETAERPFRVELHNETDVELLDEEIDALITRTRNALADNGGILYTSRGVSARLHQSAAEHLLIEGRNANAVDVARMLGIPAALLDSNAGGTSMTYTNTRDKLAEFVDFGLGMYMGAISARLSLNDVTPRGSRVAFALEEAINAAATAAGLPAPNEPEE